MTIDWWTLGLQAVNFLILVWLLTRFLYRPVRRIIEQRRALVDDARSAAEKAETDAEAEIKRYEEERAKLPGERLDMLKKAHDELEQDRKKILGTAKDEADELLAAAKTSIEDQRREALKDVKSDVAKLAGALAGRILSASAGGTLNDACLEHIQAEIKALKKEERDRLVEDLSKEGATLTVVTAAELAPDERGRWSERLAKILGVPNTPVFKIDAAIIGGAELHFPHAVLLFTWADQLKAAEKDLVSDGRDQ
jgi:F-type H+-transporting ATPase subunit b